MQENLLQKYKSKKAKGGKRKKNTNSINDETKSKGPALRSEQWSVKMFNQI